MRGFNADSIVFYTSVPSHPPASCLRQVGPRRHVKMLHGCPSAGATREPNSALVQAQQMRTRGDVITHRMEDLLADYFLSEKKIFPWAAHSQTEGSVLLCVLTLGDPLPHKPSHWNEWDDSNCKAPLDMGKDGAALRPEVNQMNPFLKAFLNHPIWFHRQSNPHYRILQDILKNISRKKKHSFSVQFYRCLA